jgi:tetratricopeptide (TPR) repeat protein
MRIAAGLIVGLLFALGPAAAPVALAEEALTPEAAEADSDFDRAARLDALFEILQSTTDASEGARAERAVWAIWQHSGVADVDALMSMSLLAMQARDYVRALVLLSRIVETMPEFAEAWNKRATVYFLVKDYEKSIADIAETLALEPRHFGALSGLGMIMERIGDDRRAIAAYHQALEVNPTLSGVRFALRLLEERSGKDI